MLQQILKDLYVDPEILAELDEQQKQTLFCKMREEQVRRWKIWDNDNPIIQLNNNNNNNSKKKKKKKSNVSFLKGIDGEPWVWVMGEHKDDKAIEQILKEEGIEKARKIAEKESEELRQHLQDYINDLTPTNKVYKDIYCSVNELRMPLQNNTEDFRRHLIDDYIDLTAKDLERFALKPNKIMKHRHFDKINDKLKAKHRRNIIETKDVLEEISLNTKKVTQKVALWEKKLTERTCEIFQNMQNKQMEQDREAEEQEKRRELIWNEQG